MSAPQLGPESWGRKRWDVPASEDLGLPPGAWVVGRHGVRRYVVDPPPPPPPPAPPPPPPPPPHVVPAVVSRPRRRGRRPIPDQFVWASHEEICAAHAAWCRGDRSPRVLEGNRLYKRHHKRLERARQAFTSTGLNGRAA